MKATAKWKAHAISIGLDPDRMIQHTHYKWGYSKSKARIWVRKVCEVSFACRLHKS